MPKRDFHLYLGDIQDSISKIETYVRGLDFEEFTKDMKTVDAVVRNLSIIGEAVKNLPDSFKAKYADVPWGEITGMRNKVNHEYFGIDEEILWQTIKSDLPPLKKQIQNLMEQ